MCVGAAGDVLFTPAQLLALAAAAGAPDAGVPAEGSDETVRLTKGRLERDDDGSTVVVRGGYEYNADTDIVTVSRPLPSGPDGILTDANGEVRLTLPWKFARLLSACRNCLPEQHCLQTASGGWMQHLLRHAEYSRATSPCH